MSNIIATVLPADHEDGVVIWGSSDVDVITITNTSSNNGRYSTVDVGAATLTAEVGLLSTTVRATVVRSATNIMINGGDFIVNNVSNVGALMATVLPTNHSSGTVFWSSSETGRFVINSNNGQWVSLSPGQVTVTASVGRVTNQIMVTISNVATNVTINESDVTVSNGASDTFTATILPPNSTDSLVWSSSSNNLVSINSNSGVFSVTNDTNFLGLATITARAGNVSDTVNVNVAILVPSTNISIDGGDRVVFNLAADTLTATVLPSDHTDGFKKWISSNTNILTINSNTGAYNAIAPGNAVVWVRVGDSTNSITITVSNTVTNMEITNGDGEALSVLSNTTGAFGATVLPAGHLSGNVIWSSGDTNYLIVRF